MTQPLIGALVLDREGLSKLVDDDRRMALFVRRARDHGAHVVTSAVTIVEARHPTVQQTRFDWFLSRIDIEPATEDIARDASKLLREAKLHGYKSASDAILAATALRQRGPVVVATSDPEDISALCGPRVRAVKV